MSLPPSPDGRQNLEITPSSPSSARSLSSSHPPSSPSTDTCVEDTDIVCGRKEAPVDVTPEEVTLLSGPSTTCDKVPSDVNPEALLKHMLDGAQQVADVEELQEWALESFKMIETWYDKTLNSGNSAVVSVMEDARAAGKDYVEAIKSSVKVAGHGVAFADDVANLCDSLSGGFDADVHNFIKEMKTIVEQAQLDAQSTYEQFREVRRKLLEIIKGIPVRQERCTKKQDPTHALELLKTAFDDVGKLVVCVGNFACWWSKAESMISTLEKQVSFKGHRMSSLRLDMVRKNWELVRQRYDEYKRTIETIADFYPVDQMRTSASIFDKLKAVFTRQK